MPGHHPSSHAKTKPDHPALVIADTGEVLTYRELDEGSNRVAHLLRSLDIVPGDHVALMLRNGPDFAKCYWGATRCGAMVTLLSTHLKPDEARYILGDCDAKALIVSASLGETPRALAADGLVPNTYFVDESPLPFRGGVGGGDCGTDMPHPNPSPKGEGLLGAQSLADALAAQPATPVPDEISGFHMLYSSGTTGRPKGIAVPFTPGPIDEYNPSEGRPDMYAAFAPLVAMNCGPLYHAAPLSGMVLTHRLGGTFVTLRKFDAEALLAGIACYKVNHAQFVPTMFVRMLALSNEERSKYDLSSLKFAIHGAAPCPVEIKRRMIEWWGPIIMEYYSSTEGVGATAITAEEWLNKPGSVGKSSMGPIHICDDEGCELVSGEAGTIWFEAPPGKVIKYRGDPDKVRKATHPDHPNWFTVGDVGRLDEDGYLFLTDRKDFMIISGGVNIYPQAIEDCLIVHPKVADAAVIGVANPEYGEEVKAVVEPKDWTAAGDDLAAELDAWCRGRISAVTCPRSYEFVRELPRIPSGKLAKHELRKLYGNPVATV